MICLNAEKLQAFCEKRQKNLEIVVSNIVSDCDMYWVNHHLWQIEI